MKTKITKTKKGFKLWSPDNQKFWVYRTLYGAQQVAKKLGWDAHLDLPTKHSQPI
jgi:hypothetical protein